MLWLGLRPAVRLVALPPDEGVRGSATKDYDQGQD